VGLIQRAPLAGLIACLLLQKEGWNSGPTFRCPRNYHMSSSRRLSYRWLLKWRKINPETTRADLRSVLG
jgi:hypothetical protein